MSKTLEEWRESIKTNAKTVGRLPHSHNIVSISLQAIAEKFGKEEANKAIRDFNLERLGWKAQP